MFVKKFRVVCYQLPDGAIGALEDDGTPDSAWRSFRNSFPESERELINLIRIPAKMGIERRKVVTDELTKIGLGSDSTGGATANVQLHVGAYQIALLRHNILSWEGPAFSGVPLTQANIADLDPDQPLVNFVLAEIGRRNPVNGAPSPDPKEAATATSTSAGDSATPAGSAEPSAAPSI